MIFIWGFLKSTEPHTCSLMTGGRGKKSLKWSNSFKCPLESSRGHWMNPQPGTVAHHDCLSCVVVLPCPVMEPGMQESPLYTDHKSISPLSSLICQLVPDPQLHKPSRGGRVHTGLYKWAALKMVYCWSCSVHCSPFGQAPSKFTALCGGCVQRLTLLAPQQKLFCFYSDSEK